MLEVRPQKGRDNLGVAEPRVLRKMLLDVCDELTLGRLGGRCMQLEMVFVLEERLHLELGKVDQLKFFWGRRVNSNNKGVCDDAVRYAVTKSNII